MANRKRLQVNFNLNSTIEADLYEKTHQLNPESFSDAVKYILFAYFYPSGGVSGGGGGGQIQQPAEFQEEEILDDVSGLPNL